MKFIASDNLPQAIGPYSPAVKVNGIIYTSAQVPVTLDGTMVERDIKVQTRQSLSNLKSILNEVGCDTRHIMKTTVFMSDLKEFDAMNEVYAQFFEEPYPSRSCVQVAALPKGAKVEIEALVIDTVKYEKSASGCSNCSGECCEGDDDCDCGH